MTFRIYVDEAGTHSDDWLIIGMLFVPDHGALHSDLLAVKKKHQYLNRRKRNTSATYKETHLKEFRSRRDVEVGEEWLDLFVQHSCYFRAVVIDWSIWDAAHFGGAFEPDALKRRRAYKKWAEMLLHPELKEPQPGYSIRDAKLYLDRLRIMYGYDVIDHLRERFTRGYEGSTPYIADFQHTESWRDANQCLQLCDILTGGLYQVLKPSSNEHKLAMRDYLASTLKPFNVASLDAGFWRGYASNSLRKHFPKYCAWFWTPTEAAAPRPEKRRRRLRRKTF